MARAVLGIFFALLFVTLESSQFVFVGGLFQRMSSFTFGFLVFGVTVIGFVGWAWFHNHGQVKIALANPLLLVGVNVSAVFAISAYLASVQLIEPAISYTISSGMMPLTAFVLYQFGVREGEPMRNRMEGAGNIVLLLGVAYLGYVTVSGFSGFVRGEASAALIGVLFALVDGFAFTWVLVFSQRLDKAGVGTGAVLGLRMIFYVIVAGCGASIGLDYKEPMPLVDVVFYTGIGFMLTIPPLYFLQKAISMISTLTISALTALGPFVIFILQLLEGRVNYSQATLIGLCIYFAGALMAAAGAVKAASDPENAF